MYKKYKIINLLKILHNLSDFLRWQIVAENEVRSIKCYSILPILRLQLCDWPRWKSLIPSDSPSQIAFHHWCLDPAWAGNAMGTFDFCTTCKKWNDISVQPNVISSEPNKLNVCLYTLNVLWLWMQTNWHSTLKNSPTFRSPLVSNPPT